MSIRGVASGVAGSAAVAIVAALSLGMTHAAADPKDGAPQVHARISPPSPSSSASPLQRARGAAATRPAWLLRLLQHRDPPMEAQRRRG